MKILLIDVNYGEGSTGKIVKELKNAIEKTNNKVLACYGRGKKSKEKNVFKFSYDIETYFHAFLSRVTGLMGYFSYFSTKKLIKKIEEFQPDIVHIHETHSYFINYLKLIEYLKSKKIKTIWTFHCEYMYTGNCGYAYECEKWKSKCENCEKIHEYPKSLFFDFTSKMYNDKKKAFQNFENLTIVTPSKWLADRVKESFLKEKKIEVVHNGLDTEIFSPREYKHLIKKYKIKDQKILLSAAPDIMSQRKGGPWLIELAKRLEKENYLIFLIGVKEIEENYPSNIIALPLIKSQIELAEYYSMADIFVLCSQKETFSMTCAEAISCGTQVVGFESGAPETVFNEGKFVEYGNLEKLEKVIKETLEKKRELDTKKYSSKNMVNTYIKIYEKGVK